LPRLTGFEDRLGHRAPPLRGKASRATTARSTWLRRVSLVVFGRRFAEGV